MRLTGIFFFGASFSSTCLSIWKIEFQTIVCIMHMREILHNYCNLCMELANLYKELVHGV